MLPEGVQGEEEKRCGITDEDVVYPSLYERILESRINKSITRRFKRVMSFFFGSSSPACSLTPVDLMKSAVVYLTSSGLLYSIIDEYATQRYTRHGTIREALSASLVVLFADISHRYVGHIKPKTPDQNGNNGYTGIPGEVKNHG